jgi:hypothetical protein
MSNLGDALHKIVQNHKFKRHSGEWGEDSFLGVFRVAVRYRIDLPDNPRVLLYVSGNTSRDS